MGYQDYQNNLYAQNDPNDPYGYYRKSPQQALMNGLGTDPSFSSVPSYGSPSGGYGNFNGGLPITGSPTGDYGASTGATGASYGGSTWGADMPSAGTAPGLSTPVPTPNPQQTANWAVGTSAGPPQGGSGSDTLTWLLNHGYAPQDAIDWIHSHPGYQGGEAAYYPNFKGGGANVIGMNGGYLNQDADGTWHWTAREEGGGAGITPPNDYLTGVGDQLSKLIASLQTPVDFNTPGVAEPLGAYRTLANSQLEQEKGDLAQQYGVEGNGATLGGLNTAQQMAREQTGRGIAQYGGNLLNQQVQARRQQLTSALQMALQLGLTTQAQQIQEELSKLGLGYNYAALGAGLNQNSLLNALNG